MKTFTLPQLAEELGMSPKMARAALRKAGLKRPSTRWSWPIAKHAEIKAVLRGKKATAKKTVARKGSTSSREVHATH